MSSQQPDDSGPTPPPDAAQPAETSQHSQPTGPGADQGRPGVRLLAERRAQGLSLGDVARQLKLSVRQVEALERDEYAAFPGPVFVRGFLRNYAKLLQLDPEAVVAQAALAPAPSIPAGPAIAPTRVPLHDATASRRGPRLGFGTLTLGLVLLIVVVAAIYDARNKPAPVSLTPPTAAPSAAPAPQHADSPPPAAPGTSVAPPAAPVASGEPAPEQPAVAPAEAPPAAPAPPPAPSSGEVKLAFDGESWVEVKDATGTVVFSRLNPAGTEEVVSGEPPLELVIGNAGSVRVTYRNRPVDLAPHTRVDVARVRLE
jgi:cytoskeleton protein RodZ